MDTRVGRILTIVASLTIGVVGHAFWTSRSTSNGVGMQTPAVGPSAAPEMTLYRFDIAPDRQQTFSEWMAFLVRERPAVLQTLDREKIYVEGIFRDRDREPNVIYWLVVKGRGGATVESSPLEVDRRHVEYMNQTIPRGSRRTFTTENNLIAPFVQQAIDAREPSGQ